MPILGENRVLLGILARSGFCIAFDRVNRCDAGFLRGFLPLLALSPCALALVLKLVAARTELRDGLFGEQLFECPLFDVLGFVVFELCDELDGTSENASFILLAAGNDFCDFVDAFVDGLAATTFD